MFFAVAVAVPGGAPDAVQVPAEAAEDFLAEPVAVAGDFGGVVLVAVAFDAERVDAGVAGVVGRRCRSGTRLCRPGG